MDFVKDLALEVVNHPDCSGSDAVHLAYLLFARDNENYRNNNSNYNDEDESYWMEQPF